MANVADVLGVAKKTPMAIFLNEWGIEPDLKYISWTARANLGEILIPSLAASVFQPGGQMTPRPPKAGF